MNNNSCDILLDYFNDQLSEEQRKEFETHLLYCEECQDELAELEQLVEDLPYAAEPVNPPEGMKGRILTTVKDENKNITPLAHKQTEAEGKSSYAKETENKTKNKSWMKPLIAAALTLSLAGNGAALLYINNQDNEVAEEPPAEPINESLDAIKQSLTLNPSSGVNAEASALMIEQNEKMNLVIEANNLPPLEGEETYQVWVLKDDQPHRAGTFVTNAEGKGAVSYLLEGDKSWETIAITKEPNANSQKPKGEILLSSPI
ncbi:anti-sigma factor [Virgibacillus halodenitrificans]|uniref:anti-sigma factor n=1 Tax=Virgibacillus halodenitrificans TaxID=1482 RepID=UPI002DBAACF7|nr:anti-sigma factor [Virgibacillus halodenitrificans]MEC2157824.1 anti-sigma factor [Virgibacillus halodenitrificans]